MLAHKYHQHKETIHNFTWRSLQIFGKQGITFIIFILAAKLLDPYTFGIYNYILAIVFFLVMFGDFGISTATSKYVAEYNVTDKEKLKSVLFSSGVLILALTIVISILTVIIGPYILGDKYVYVLYTLPLIFLMPLSSLYDGIYRGLKRFKQLAIISLIIGLISLSFVYILIKQYGLIGALISQNLFYLILVVGLGVGYREIKIKVNPQVMREIGKYSFAFGVAILGYYLFSRVGVIILGYYNYIEEIAVYELLNKLLIILLIPFQILAMVVAPNFTEYYAKKNYRLILSKFKKYFIIFLLASIIFAILSYLILPSIILIFFNEYYNKILFALLIPVIFIYTSLVYCTVINTGIIISTGYAKIMAYSNVFIGIFNVFLSIILINYLGFIGVIYSTLILHILAITFYHAVYYSKIKNLAKNG
ncbi:hypothetical protein A3K73_08100 [Candidatus Pacearchaeota archaeon RBG_13_36_9]|nr:MAG: hypothetical protein A3K73_08100 [Candidatus Pacearchaeota archaeon RBG_13_36_9]